MGMRGSDQVRVREGKSDNSASQITVSAKVKMYAFRREMAPRGIGLDFVLETFLSISESTMSFQEQAAECNIIAAGNKIALVLKIAFELLPLWLLGAERAERAP